MKDSLNTYFLIAKYMTTPLKYLNITVQITDPAGGVLQLTACMMPDYQAFIYMQLYLVAIILPGVLKLFKASLFSLTEYFFTEAAIHSFEAMQIQSLFDWTFGEQYNSYKISSDQVWLTKLCTVLLPISLFLLLPCILIYANLRLTNLLIVTVMLSCQPRLYSNIDQHLVDLHQEQRVYLQ